MKPVGEFAMGDWADLIRREPPRSFDAVFMDPPYGRVTDNRWDRAPDWALLATELARVVRGPGCPVLVFCRIPEAMELWNAFRGPFVLWDEFLWFKGDQALWTGGKKPRHLTEPIWWFLPRGSKSKDIYWDPVGSGLVPPRRSNLKVRPFVLTTSQRGSFRRVYLSSPIVGPPSIIAAMPSKHQKAEHLGHSTQKPASLLEPLIRLLVPPGGRVLDPFAGTGSTIRAALRAGRSAKGFEIDARWREALAESLKATGAP